MATELTKYQLVPTDNNIVNEFRPFFCTFKPKKTYAFVYGVVFVFIGVTVFLAFSPSSTSTSSSWFNFFSVNYTYPPNQSVRSPLYPNLPSNLTQISLDKSSRSQNTAQENFEVNSTNSIVPEKPINQISTNSSNQDGNFELASNSTDKVANFELNTTSQISTSLPQVPPVQSDQDENFEHTDANNKTNLPQISTNTSSQQQPPHMSDTSEAAKASPTSSFFDEVEPNTTNSDTIVPQISPNISSQKQPPPSKSDTSDATKASPPLSNLEKVEPNATNNDVANSKLNTTSTPQKEGNLSSVILPKLPPQSSVETVSSKGQEGKGVVSNFTASLSRKQDSNSGTGTVSTDDKKKEGKSLIGSLVGCDLYDGNWIRDESYPIYKPGSCKFIDEQFNCKLNGRPDDDYQKLKWKPKGCTLPRMNGRQMLNLLRNKRLAFVGDSLNRNMWESLVCILKNSVKNPKNVHEAHGRRYFRNEAFYSFVFKDYNCTVEFFVAPFLVSPWEVKEKDGTTKETLRLDVVVEESEHFKTADIIIFNTGHWWTHEKTSKGEDYYQEGSKVYKQLDVIEAFRKAITTWGRWVDKNINPQKTHVFFRGYSNTHFHGGQWNSGGQCNSETEPIRNETYLTHHPWKMKVFEKVMSGIKVPISYLNITRMTDYRKDAHPSIYRKQKLSGEEKKSPLRFQDCSHWCLPGVPDIWNELLFAEMLRKKYQDQQQT